MTENSPKEGFATKDVYHFMEGQPAISYSQPILRATIDTPSHAYLSLYRSAPGRPEICICKTSFIKHMTVYFQHTVAHNIPIAPCDCLCDLLVIVGLVDLQLLTDQLRST